MKRTLLTILLAFCFFQTAQLFANEAASNAGTVVAAKMLTQHQSELPAAVLNMTAADFLKMTPKKVKEMTGHKLTLKQTIALKATQKMVKKQLGDDAGSSKSQIVALLLCWFLGGLGIHRLYLGYKNWWVMLITLGGCGIWALIDLIRIIMGDLKPADGSNYDPSF
jgi:hypothetical protein